MRGLPQIQDSNLVYVSSLITVFIYYCLKSTRNCMGRIFRYMPRSMMKGYDSDRLISISGFCSGVGAHH